MSRFERFSVFALLLLAVFLRAPKLGEPGLWIDEDLTHLSVDGVLAHGVPRHPSGGIYMRAPLHTYAAAASTAIFGRNETSLRLPSLLFGIVGLWVAFRFARDIGGKTVAFTTLLLLTFSSWDVFYSRMARMYAPTILLFTLTVWLAWRLGVKEDRRVAPWMVLSGVVATTMHPLASSLATVYLVVLLLPRVDRFVKGWTWAGIASIGVTLVTYSEIGKRIWAAGGPAAVSPALASTTWRIPGLGGMTVENAVVLLGESVRSPRASVLAGAVLIALLVAGVYLWDRRTRQRAGAGFPVLVWAACSTLNMPAVAALAALWWARWTSSNRRDALRRVLGAGASTGLLTVALISAAALSGRVPDLLSKRGLAHVFGVPEPWWYELGRAFPIMLGIVVVGASLLFLDSFDSGDDGSGLFVAGAFVCPLVLMGFVQSPYVQLRYVAPLNPLFVLLFVLSLRRIGVALRHRAQGVDARLSRWSPVGRGLLFACVALLLADQSSPREAWTASHLHYGSNKDRIRNPDVASHFYYDVKTTGEFVAKAREPGDLVIAREGPGTFIYAGNVDFVLRRTPYDGMAVAKDGTIVDRNLGVPVLDSVDRLAEVIRTHTTGDVWLIVSFTESKVPVVNLPEGFGAWIESRGVRPVCTGLDGITRVYRFDSRSR